MVRRCAWIVTAPYWTRWNLHIQVACKYIRDILVNITKGNTHWVKDDNKANWYQVSCSFTRHTPRWSIWSNVHPVSSGYAGCVSISKRLNEAFSIAQRKMNQHHSILLASMRRISRLWLELHGILIWFWSLIGPILPLRNIWGLQRNREWPFCKYTKAQRRNIAHWYFARYTAVPIAFSQMERGMSSAHPSSSSMTSCIQFTNSHLMVCHLLIKGKSLWSRTCIIWAPN